MQIISDESLAAHEDITVDGGADDFYVQTIVDDLRAARRTIALIRMRNGIDMLSTEENEFELGIRHSATFIQEILDDEVTSEEAEALVSTATALGVEAPSIPKASPVWLGSSANQ